MKLSLLAFFVAWSCSSPALAREIFQWVDKNGQTHLSDVVPAEYSKTAKRINSGNFEVSPEELKAAQIRANKEKEFAEAARRAREGAQAKPSDKKAGQTAAPTPSKETLTTCEQKIAAFKKSEECFQPFRVKNGTVKAQAYEKCTVAPNPYTDCERPIAR